MNRYLAAALIAAGLAGGATLLSQFPPKPYDVQVGPMRVSVPFTTATQAVLTYTAPNGDPCSVTVSESVFLSPSVHDTDTTLFSGSDQDNREGNITNGTARTVVVGRYSMTVPYGAGSNPFLAADGKRYSRALAANTTHYYKITCGATVQTGSFTTRDVPMGLTYVPGLAVASAGAYNFPSWPTNRSTTVIDPLTGVKLRPVGYAVEGTSTPFWESSASHLTCSPVAYQGGRLCVQPVKEASSYGLLYYVHPTTGSVLLGRTYINYSWCQTPCLGPVAHGWSGDVSPSWSTTAWNQWYSVVETRYGAGGAACSTGVNCRHVLARATFTGALTETSANANASISEALLQSVTASPEQSVEALWAAADSRYSSGLYMIGPAENAVSANDQYYVAYARRASQNSYGFLGSFNIAATPPTMVGSFQTGASGSAKWCGIHGVGNVWESDIALFRPIDMYETGPTNPGPWYVQVWGDAGHTVGVAAGTTEFYVSGEPTCTKSPATGCHGLTAEDDTHLADASVGDLFTFGSGAEKVRIATKTSSTQWTVQRAQIGSTAASHVAGAQGYMACGANVYGYTKLGYWQYASDATGSGITYDTSGASEGHYVARPSGRWGEQWNFIAGLWDTLTATHVDRKFIHAPAFAGVSPPSPLNSYPVWHNSEASGTASKWMADNALQTGTGMSNGQPSALASGGYANIWRFFPSATQSPNRHLPHIGFVDATPLIEKSGPSVALTDSDLGVFCIANAANECINGSSAGDVYIVSARTVGVDQFQCIGSESSGTKGMCVGNASSDVNAVVQVGMDATASCSGSPTPTCGNERLRVVQTVWRPYQFGTSNYTGMKPWTDGSAIISYGAWTGSDSYPMLLIVPTPYTNTVSSVAMNTYLSKTVTVPDVSATYPTLTEALVKFGYLDNGSVTDFRCTQRGEACQIGSASPLNWTYASEPVTAKPCAAGCSIVVPVIPSKVAYYQIVYRDASHAVLGVSAVGVVGGW